MRWATGVSEEEMGVSGWPALPSPDSPGGPGVLELEEVLGFSRLCLLDLPHGWGAASGQIFWNHTET